MRGARGTWLALVLATAALVVAPAGAARAALPGYCPTSFPAADTYVWNPAVTDGLWTQSDPLTNWLVPPGYPRSPNDFGDGPGDPTPSYVCIGPGVTVHLVNTQDFMNYVQALYLGQGSTLDITEGTGVFVNGAQESFADSGSQIRVDRGRLGGVGTLRTIGLVSVSSAVTSVSTLTADHPNDPIGTGGSLHIDTGGSLVLPGYGVNLFRGHRIVIDGSATLTTNAFIAADWGTSTTIGPGGVLTIAGDGGYYQGFAVAAQPLDALTNAGTIRKTAGPGVSVVDARYTEVGAGHVEVGSGTLALPDGNVNAAPVAAGRTLSTGRCEDRLPGDPCVLTTDPAQDDQAVSFTVPAADGNGARVLVHEDGTRVFTAHAEDLQASGANPAVIEMRMASTSSGETPVGLDVVHVDARGVEVVLPPCPAVGFPAAATNCVDRTSSHAAGGNLFMVVRTMRTSRYICRREDVVPPVYLADPVAPKVRLGRPIAVSAAINEAGTIKVSGTIRTKKVKVRGLRLSGSVSPAPGDPGTVVLRLKGHKKRLLRDSGARKGVARLTVTATDLHGNVTTRTLTVRLA